MWLLCKEEKGGFSFECLTNRGTESFPYREANLIRQKREQSTLGGTIQLLQKMEDFSDTVFFSEHPLWHCSVLQERDIFLKKKKKKDRVNLFLILKMRKYRVK